MQAKSKTYGMRRTTEYITQLGGINIADQIVAVGAEECSVSDDACVLYPNPYMVVTKTGYTKHYYAGTERLATVIGGGGLGEIGNPVDRQHSQHDLDIISSFHSRYSDYDPFEHENNLSEPVGTVGIDGTSNPRLDYTCSPIVLTDLDVLTHQNILLEAIEQNAPTMTLEQNVYFFHGDHLGSANWITDGGGNPIQYIHYAPYGEQIANQQTIGYDERFKFTGKERDWETGYDYFGARFYDHRKGIWNSVDPLADKYPNVTPYLYCNGNPIMLVDPDGRDVWELDGTGSVVNKIADKTQDAIRMNGKQISFEPNSITSVSQDNYQTTFTFENEGIASSTFKFLADNSSVEYGLVNSSQKSTIVTQHVEGNVNTMGIIESAISNKEVVNYIIHNHPSSSGPSGFSKGSIRGDKFALQKTEKKLGYNVLAYVYQPKNNSLWPFSSSSRNVESSTWLTPTIGTQSSASPSWTYRIKNFFGFKMKL